MKKTVYNSPEVKVYAVRLKQQVLNASPTSSTDSFGTTNGNWDDDDE